MAENDTLTDPQLFDRDRILLGIQRLDAVLEQRGSAHQTLIVVGGSYLALADLREATKDIDTVTRLAESMREAIEEVAAMLDLPPLWLNDQAAMFRPTGLNEHHCHVEYAGQTLTMLVPTPDWVFLMKLYAARAIDRPDMIRLWPHTGFTSPGQAVERYWDAYPHAREDDHLESFVAAIAKSAAGG